MADLITTLAPYLGPSGVLAAVIVYFIINSQRKDTKTERDEKYNLLEYRVGQIELNQTTLSDSIKELQNSIISLQMSVNELVLEIKHMKENK